MHFQIPFLFSLLAVALTTSARPNYFDANADLDLDFYARDLDEAYDNFLAARSAYAEAAAEAIGNSAPPGTPRPPPGQTPFDFGYKPPIQRAPKRNPFSCGGSPACN